MCGQIVQLALAEATRNGVLTLFLNSIVDILQDAGRLVISTPGAGQRSSYYHRRILEAVKANDGEEAFNAMNEDMQQTQRDMNASLCSEYRYHR